MGKAVAVANRDDYAVNPQLEKEAQEVVRIWSSATQDMHRGCKLYVALLEKWPEAATYMESVGINKSFLRRMEEVGRDRLHHSLVFRSGENYNRLARCSYSEQEKHINKPVEVLTASGDVLLVKVPDLTHEQVAQVFSHDHIRDIPAQRAYLESVKTVKAVMIARKSAKPYTVSKRGLQVGDLLITKRELLEILGDME